MLAPPSGLHAGLPGPVERSQSLTKREVSANNRVRDQLRELVQQHVDEDIRFLELDFQPTKARVWWSSRRTKGQDESI